MSYKDILTKLESLLYKALRGIDLAELPIIVAVIALLLACRCNCGRVIECGGADYVNRDADR